MDIYSHITEIGVIAVLAHIVYELLDRFVFSKTPAQRITKLETNDLHEITERFDRMQEELNKIYEKLDSYGNRISVIETLLKVK